MESETATATGCEQSLQKLLDYCRSQNWSGYDPYDGLNSFLSRLAPLRNRPARTALTQLIKRSPVNFRSLVGVKKDLNPKGVALAARSIILLAERRGLRLPARLDEIDERAFSCSDDELLLKDFKFLMRSLASLRSRDFDEACWGYNFDWQSRAFFAPRGTPNVVCTVFAAHAYLDWFERSGDEQALEVAKSSGKFLLDRLNRSETPDAHCFSYTPLDRSRVHNVNMLAAELLARLFGIEARGKYRVAAEKAARYTLERQREDGSWPYGEAESQRWIDSFHTGFVIVSLKRVIEQLSANQWSAGLARAHEFYEKRFFLADYRPKYYHDRLYPVDVHSAAQAVITFTEMSDLMPEANQKAKRAARWAIENLQDPSGFFYFQRHRLFTIKIPYIRWAQTWMLYALSLYLSKKATGENV